MRIGSDVGSVFRNVETHAHVALCAEMINLIGLQFIKKLYKIHRIAEITVMQEHSDPVHVRVGVEVVNARSVECAGAPNDPVDFVAFLEQQISQITSVLTGDACDQRPFHQGNIVGRFCETPTQSLEHWPSSTANSVLVLTPVNPQLDERVLDRARELAHRALRGMRNCRVIYHNAGEAPQRGAMATFPHHLRGTPSRTSDLALMP